MIYKASASFGCIGAIIGLFISALFPILPNAFDSLTFQLFSGGLGFLLGFVGTLIIIKIAGITEKDLAKGLSYECQYCKGSVFETESHCSTCGKANISYKVKRHT